MVEFLKYSKDVLYLAFKGAWAIATSIAFIVTILGGIIAYKLPWWNSIVKMLLWLIPLIIFGLCLLINIALVIPYRIYKGQQQKINKLQNELATSQERTDGTSTTTTDTKQDIRTLLESINPLILQKIDAGEKEIHMRIGMATQMKLSELSKRPDFDNFLSFTKTKKTIIGNGQAEDFIKELDENSFTTGYYLYPKDALVK